MSVETEHPAYTAYKDQWRRCRDTISGQDEVHGAGEKYLPRLTDQDDAQYDSYKMRARFLNAMQRTVEGLTGLVMRKDPIVTGTYEDFLIDVTGMTVQQYMLGTLTEILSVGRGGTYIDFPVSPGGLSVAQAERLAMQPTWSFYPAEDIINWKKNDEAVYTLVVLREYYTKVNNDEFSNEEDVRYRVLDIEPKTQKYRVRVMQQDGSLMSDEVFPKQNGQTMDFIPFIEHGTFKPTLLDVADNNLQHYRLSADHNHGLHYVALPTPYITGIDKNDAPSTIGPQKLWILENQEAKVGLLEFEGQGLQSIKEELAAIEKNMAQLGARMLSDMAGDETATAANIRNSAETSALSNIVVSLNEDFRIITNITNEWMDGDSENSEVEYNKDFTPTRIDAQTITVLVAAWQAGSITLETLIENLQAGEIVSGDITAEDYADKLSAELPPGMSDQLTMQEEQQKLNTDDGGE